MFGEQPSAAKWNILGTNDASFNDGTGIADGAVTSTKLAEAFFRGRYQKDTTDNTITGYTVQMGWGQKVGDSTRNMTESITFDSAFSSAPLIIATLLGIKATTGATVISDFGTGTANHKVSAESITTTGFSVRLARTSDDGTDPGTFSSSNYYGYSWIAIGPV